MEANKNPAFSDKRELFKNLNHIISQVDEPAKGLLMLGLQIAIRDYLKGVA